MDFDHWPDVCDSGWPEPATDGDRGRVRGGAVRVRLLRSYVFRASAAHLEAAPGGITDGLYTEGLFHYAVHINYFGDLLLFTGFSLITGSPYTLLVPAVMLAGFIFANIPALDAHLHAKYGATFDAYAAKTKKLIPLIY